MSDYFYIAEVTYHTLQNKPSTKSVSNVISKDSVSLAFQAAEREALEGFKAYHGIEPTVLITRFSKID